MQVARHLSGPASRHADHDPSASCFGRVGVEKRPQNKSSCLLGQLGGLPPDDSGDELAAQVVRSLEEGVDTPALHAAASCAIELTGVMGFTPPSWSNLALGARPPPSEAEDLEPGAQRRGWQHEASSRVERRHRSVILFPQLTEADKALTRSQSGTGAGVALTTTPSNLHTRIEPQLFRVLLLRRPSSSLISSLLLATAQLAVESECWGDGVLPLRAQLRRSAARPVAESPLICL